MTEINYWNTAKFYVGCWSEGVSKENINERKPTT